MPILPTRLSRAQTADRNSCGPEASSGFSPPRDSTTSRSAASPAARKSAPNTASAEILRARDLLRDVLLREDETEETVLVGKVSNGLNEIIARLDNLAGLQQLFEVWSR